MTDAWLIIETSGREGMVGLARGERLVREVTLDSAVKRNADLAQRVGAVIAEEGLNPKDLLGVMVSLGPGSFTGLRVGVISAKTLAYAAKCRLIAVPTFHAIARGVPNNFDRVDVISDALKGNVFIQAFRRSQTAEWEPLHEAKIVPVAMWVESLEPTTIVSGPGLDVHEKSIPTSIARMDVKSRMPTLESVLQVGLKIAPLSSTETMALEPLYLRGSSAEEKAAGG